MAPPAASSHKGPFCADVWWRRYNRPSRQLSIILGSRSGGGGGGGLSVKLLVEPNFKLGKIGLQFRLYAGKQQK